MSLTVRRPLENECAAITALCMRSKAHWGYNEDFMRACAKELEVTAENLDTNFCAVALIDDNVIGFVEVSLDAERCELEKLFVDPSAMGAGIGRALMDEATGFTRDAGATHMTFAADPAAVPFYLRMGAEKVGVVPSGSIPGRTLPLMQITLA